MTNQSGFSEFEKQAMKERALELRKEQENKRSKKNPEADVLEAIAAMPTESALIAAKIHALVEELVPGTKCKTWYGMPAYMNDAGKIVMFFKEAEKYESRYCTLGFDDAAQLDDTDMWATSYALVAWNEVVADKVKGLISTAFGV